MHGWNPQTDGAGSGGVSVWEGSDGVKKSLAINLIKIKRNLYRRDDCYEIERQQGLS